MKKSSRYIYARPVPRKRHNVWRPLLLVACLALMACLFFYQGEKVNLGLFPNSQLTGQDSGQSIQVDLAYSGSRILSPNFFYDNTSDAVSAQPEPVALNVIFGPEQPLDINAIADLAAQAPEAEELPAMQLASLGQGKNPFQNLPFFLPAPRQESALPMPPYSDLFEDLFEQYSAPDNRDGPVLYPGNERYTVEYDPNGLQILCSEIISGDTCGVLLNEWITNAEIMQMVEAAEPVHSLTRIRVGKPFSLVRDPQTESLLKFQYEIDNSSILVVERTENGFVASKEQIVYDTELVRVTGTINSSLFEAVTETGEGASLAIAMSDIFSCEVNFITQIRQGDSFELLVEKQYRDGQFKGYGRMLAAHFTNRGKTFEAYLFPDPDGKLHYYNAEGEAIQRLLLKAPLNYTRISSGYSMSRVHPVFGDARPHQGVDYAAPRGTPIVAVGDGTITKAGWGNGYGNMIIIKHAGGLESQYAHLSGFASGIKTGTTVTQGQTIGFVGSTGTATGPHLDFRLKQDGNWVNPESVIVPRLDPIASNRVPLFQNLQSQMLSYLHGETELAQYVPIAWDE